MIESTATGLAVALGSGLLIGLERERRKGRGPSRRAAGIRSFALAASAGGLAQALQQPVLVAVGAALVALLAGVAYAASRRHAAGAVDDDPGLTTELALFVTYLVGVLSVQQPALGAAAAVVVATLLALRERLHRFATQALSQAELHDMLLLAALALVLMPLLPAAPLPVLGGLAPRSLLAALVLILAMQGVGHVIGRVFGPGLGLALAGLASGFVSSTATVAAMGARFRSQPGERAGCLAGALWSTAATWMQALALLALLAPTALAAVLPLALAGAAVAAASGGWSLRRGVAAASPQPATPQTQAAPQAGPLRLRAALAVAATLLVVSLVVAAAQSQLGAGGLYTATALGGAADAHAPVAALGSLFNAGQIDVSTLQHGVLVAIGANSVTRSAVAFTAGGRGYGLRVASTLLASLAAAAGILASGLAFR